MRLVKSGDGRKCTEMFSMDIIGNAAIVPLLGTHMYAKLFILTYVHKMAKRRSSEKVAHEV